MDGRSRPVASEQSPDPGQDPRRAIKDKDAIASPLSLLLRLLDLLAVGERVLDGAELRKCLAAIVFQASAEGGIARTAARHIGVAASSIDRADDATESAALLILLLCRQRLSPPVVLRTSQ